MPADGTPPLDTLEPLLMPSTLTPATSGDVDVTVIDANIDANIDAKPQPPKPANTNTPVNTRMSNFLAPLTDRLTAISNSRAWQKLTVIFSTNFIKDDFQFNFSHDGIPLIDIEVKFNKEKTRCVKFLLLAYLFIRFDHWLIREHDTWERDPRYTATEFAEFDLHTVLLDSMWFFIVGRYFERPGVDRLAFIVPCVCGFVFWSVLATVDFTKYSISTYDIMCRWPWQLFLFMITVVLLVSTITALHIWKAFKDGIFISRISEVLVTLVVFLLVNISDPWLHLHHWFTGWFIGQHANQKYWWSLVSSAIMWGAYVNGIASWGRDPLLGCKYAFWAATNQYCEFMECYFEDDDPAPPTPSGETNAPTMAPALIEPDWRTCNATYAP